MGLDMSGMVSFRFGRLMAMQIAFDLADSEAQQFCQTVSACDDLKLSDGGDTGVTEGGDTRGARGLR